MKKDKKFHPNTVKGGIIETVISLVILVGVFALAVYDNDVSSTTRFYSRIGFYILIFVVALISFLNGIMTIIIVSRNKNKNKEDKTDIGD